MMTMFMIYQDPYLKLADSDPLVPTCVYLKGLPAIDTGGVLYQVFSNAFHAVANNEVIKNISVGDENKRLPVFSNEIVVNGYFETLGKMITHSLMQWGPGSLILPQPSTDTWSLEIFSLLCSLSK